MNWWLVALLALWALGDIYQVNKAKTLPEYTGAVIAIVLVWGLIYLSGIFTLL